MPLYVLSSTDIYSHVTGILVLKINYCSARPDIFIFYVKSEQLGGTMGIHLSCKIGAVQPIFQRDRARAIAIGLGVK